MMCCAGWKEARRTIRSEGSRTLLFFSACTHRYGQQRALRECVGQRRTLARVERSLRELRHRALEVRRGPNPQRGLDCSFAAEMKRLNARGRRLQRRARLDRESRLVQLRELAQCR